MCEKQMKTCKKLKSDVAKCGCCPHLASKVVRKKVLHQAWCSLHKKDIHSELRNEGDYEAKTI